MLFLLMVCGLPEASDCGKWFTGLLVVQYFGYRYLHKLIMGASEYPKSVLRLNWTHWFHHVANLSGEIRRIHAGKKGTPYSICGGDVQRVNISFYPVDVSFEREVRALSCGSVDLARWVLQQAEAWGGGHWDTWEGEALTRRWSISVMPWSQENICTGWWFATFFHTLRIIIPTD